MEENYGIMTNNIDTKVVILDNGEYPKSSIPLQILANAKMVVCCDGAANEYVEKGNVPYAIIGDGDSLSENVKKSYANLLIKIPDQETNDLTKAVNFLLSKGIKEFAILGATGKREDHTLGNISLLMDYHKEGITTAMFTDFGVFIPTSNDSTFSSYPGEQISIINFNAVNLHSDDLVYPLYDFKKWWQGTLNEAKSDSFTIHAIGNYMVFLNY